MDDKTNKTEGKLISINSDGTFNVEDIPVPNDLEEQIKFIKDDLKEKIIECIHYLNQAMLKSNKKNIDKYKMELNVLIEQYKNML